MGLIPIFSVQKSFLYSYILRNLVQELDNRSTVLVSAYHRHNAHKQFRHKEVSYANLTGGEGFLGVSPSKLGKKTPLTSIILYFAGSRENLVERDRWDYFRGDLLFPR